MKYSIQKKMFLTAGRIEILRELLKNTDMTVNEYCNIGTSTMQRIINKTFKIVWYLLLLALVWFILAINQYWLDEIVRIIGSFYE